MKFLLPFIFSSVLFFTLTAQDTSSQNYFTGGILLDKYTQIESYNQTAAFSTGFEQPELAGNPIYRVYDGDDMRAQLSLGLKKINTKGNIIAINIFAGREKWTRNKVVIVESEELELLAAVPIFIGVVEQHTFGSNVTKSFCITKDKTRRLRGYLGARTEGMYTTGKYESDYENEYRTDRQRVDFQIAFVPEAVYFFPGDKFSVSASSHLLPIGLEWHKSEKSDPSLTEEQKVNSYQVFDFMNHSKSRFEIRFGWLL